MKGKGTAKIVLWSYPTVNMLNTAIIMGRLTADPELRTTGSGITTTRFTVAVDRNYVKAGEEKKTDFISCVAWRQNADFISKYFQKGSMIAVTGSIQTRMYDDKNGNKRKATEVVVDRASFCGSKAETGTGGFPASVPAASATPSFSNAGPADFEEIVGDDDDLPF